MLIELKSSANDPMNTASRMLQRFKETLILRPNSKIALQSALITSNNETYTNLLGGWKHNGDSATSVVFDETGANDYWKYKTGGEWWRPSTGNSWAIFTTEPLAFGTAPNKTATLNPQNNTITIQTDMGFLVKEGTLQRKYLKTNEVVGVNDATILVNLTNFPINSRNASGNTDNHIATISTLQEGDNEDQQFYEPYNPTAHSLDNENDLNMNFIELELLNSDGTQRTDLIHPTQITLQITNEISSK